MKFKRLETRWTAARPGALNNPWRRRKFAPDRRRTDPARRWRSRSDGEFRLSEEEERRQDAAPFFAPSHSAPVRRGAPRNRARSSVRTSAPPARAEFAASEALRPRRAFAPARKYAAARSASIFASTPRAAGAAPRSAPGSRGSASAPRFSSRSDFGSRAPEFASRPVSRGDSAPHAAVPASRFVSRKNAAPYAKSARGAFGVPASSALRPVRAARDGIATVRNSASARGLKASAPAAGGSGAPLPAGFAAHESAPRRRFAPFTRRPAVSRASSDRAFTPELRAAFDVARAPESGAPSAVDPPHAARSRNTLGLALTRRPGPAEAALHSGAVRRERTAWPKRARTAFPGAFAAPSDASPGVPAFAPRPAPARRSALPVAVPWSAARGGLPDGPEPAPDALGALWGGWDARTTADGSARSLAAIERLVKEARDALHALVRGQSRAVTLDTDWS